jgi:hypothetical protein
MWNEFWGWLASLPPGSASFVGTLAGSSFGLLAILAGALVNAHLNRKRDDVQRDHERVALASALYAEFKGVHRSFTENAEHLKSKPLDGEGGFFVPQPSTDLTPELLPKLGLLNTETIRKVMDAYTVTRGYLSRLVLLGGRLQRGLPRDREQVYLDSRHGKTVATMNVVMAGVVKEAMDALAPYLK